MPEGMTVKELCAVIERTINDAFGEELWVTGSISGLSRSANGHVYFNLVDPTELGQAAAATLPVALFAKSKQRVNAILRKTGAVRMSDGVEIRIRGAVTFYQRQGRVQLIMSLIDPAFTLGQIEMARSKLLNDLRTEGLLDANTRLERPVLPLRIALITSAGSAAHADFRHELESSPYPFEITLIDTRVQGEDAPRSICAAFNTLKGLPVDVAALVRGGGARTDLVAFDHASVARAIARSPFPVFSGIGHEIDRAVADEVAAVAAKTPTACAAMLVELVSQFEQRVDRASERIAASAGNHLGLADLHLSASRTRLSQAASLAIGTQEARITAAAMGISFRTRHLLEQAEHKLSNAEILLAALDPAAALARGWSITHRSSGQLVRSIDDVALGDELVTTVTTGKIVSTVTSQSAATPQPPTNQSTETPKEAHHG